MSNVLSLFGSLGSRFVQASRSDAGRISALVIVAAVVAVYILAILRKQTRR